MKYLTVFGLTLAACLTGAAHAQKPGIDCSVAPSGAGKVIATPVASHVIADAPGKTLTSVRLEVTPGANSNPHQHAGLLYVYVLEGAVCSQLTGDAGLKPYVAGDAFFEPPGSQHLGFTNPTDKTARVLVTQVADTGATLTTPLAPPKN